MIWRSGGDVSCQRISTARRRSKLCTRPCPQRLSWVAFRHQPGQKRALRKLSLPLGHRSRRSGNEEKGRHSHAVPRDGLRKCMRSLARERVRAGGEWRWRSVSAAGIALAARQGCGGPCTRSRHGRPPSYSDQSLRSVPAGIGSPRGSSASWLASNTVAESSSAALASAGASSLGQPEFLCNLMLSLPGSSTLATREWRISTGYRQGAGLLFHASAPRGSGGSVAPLDPSRRGPRRWPRRFEQATCARPRLDSHHPLLN